jgi:hypothetical protein
MDTHFPKTLVAYEIAVERSLRILRASGNPNTPDPDAEAISDAFFRKIPPGEFATDWTHRMEEPPESSDTVPEEGQSDPGDTTPDLF